MRPENDTNNNLVRLESTDLEMFYFTDVKHDFKEKRWFWNSTGETVLNSSWDNQNEFESHYPFMQDAAAYMISNEGNQLGVFVSFHWFNEVPIVLFLGVTIMSTTKIVQ